MLFVCDIQGVSFLVRCRNGQMQLWAFAAKEVSFLAARQKQYWMNLKVKQPRKQTLAAKVGISRCAKHLDGR
jgi:hypothetical protein